MALKKQTLKAGRSVNWSPQALRDSLQIAAVNPTNSTEECAMFKALDIDYATDPRSPLHHDNRCTVSKVGIKH